jgi:hypothetical protein
MVYIFRKVIKSIVSDKFMVYIFRKVIRKQWIRGISIIKE